jgi:hypothetical protein
VIVVRTGYDLKPIGNQRLSGHQIPWKGTGLDIPSRISSSILILSSGSMCRRRGEQCDDFVKQKQKQDMVQALSKLARHCFVLEVNREPIGMRVYWTRLSCAFCGSI